MDSCDTCLIAWAAGLFEGEGSITDANGRPRLTLKMTDGDAVERFANAVGLGRIYGPYVNRMGEKDGYTRKPYFLWISECGDALAVADLIGPWLGARRQERLKEMFGSGVIPPGSHPLTRVS